MATDPRAPLFTRHYPRDSRVAVNSQYWLENLVLPSVLTPPPGAPGDQLWHYRYPSKAIRAQVAVRAFYDNNPSEIALFKVPDVPPPGVPGGRVLDNPLRRDSRTAVRAFYDSEPSDIALLAPPAVALPPGEQALEFRYPAGRSQVAVRAFYDSEGSDVALLFPPAISLPPGVQLYDLLFPRRSRVGVTSQSDQEGNGPSPPPLGSFIEYIYYARRRMRK